MPEDIIHRILGQARNLFLRYGVRSVTMDEVVQQLGMSKKTLYQHFANKADIVLAVVRGYLQEQKEQSDRISAEAENAIDQEFRLLLWAVQVFRDMNPSLIFEVQKYFPQAWEEFDAFKNGYLREKVHQNLIRGVEEGLYRPELDLELISYVRLAQVDISITQEELPPGKYAFSQVTLVLFDLYLRGIVTAQGREMLEAYLEQIDEVNLTQVDA